MNIFAALRAENDMLREEIRQLRDALRPPDVVVPFEWKLTRSERQLFGHLASRDMVTRESAILATYGCRATDPPDKKVLDVRVHKMRRKLKPFGVVIETVWGQGFRLHDRHLFRKREQG